ncbi:hypothetical protein LguiA_004428 [Lonicera macranthoides]
MDSSNGYLNEYNLHHNPNSIAYHHRHPHSIGSSLRDVTYRCGACGYDLNLSSSSRNTSTIGSKYRKSMKKGIISFLYVDESRFTQVEEFRCLPFFFIFKRSWGLFRRRTKLLCRKCGNRIGVAYDDNSKSHLLVSDGPHLASSNGIPTYRKYDIRIRALQPTSTVELGTPLLS